MDRNHDDEPTRLDVVLPSGLVRWLEEESMSRGISRDIVMCRILRSCGAGPSTLLSGDPLGPRNREQLPLTPDRQRPTEYLGIYVPADLKARVRELAQKDGSAMTAVAHRLISAGLSSYTKNDVGIAKNSRGEECADRTLTSREAAAIAKIPVDRLTWLVREGNGPTVWGRLTNGQYRFLESDVRRWAAKNAWWSGSLRGKTKDIMAAILWRCGDGDHCYVSHSQLALDTGLSSLEVAKRVTSLGHRSLLTIHRMPSNKPSCLVPAPAILALFKMATNGRKC